MDAQEIQKNKEARKALQHKRVAGVLIAFNILLFIVLITEIVVIIISFFNK
jgi:hypothetical protein